MKGVWLFVWWVVSRGEFFTSRYEGWVVALRSGFLGYACAGVPGEAFPAFAGWLLSRCWLWVEFWSFSGSLVGIEKVLLTTHFRMRSHCRPELTYFQKGLIQAYKDLGCKDTQISHVVQIKRSTISSFIS